MLERRSTNLTFCFSEHPFQSKEIAAYLIPLRALRWLTHRKQFDFKPVLVFGPSHGLYPSFQQGCADYLREPWEERELVARLEHLRITPLLCYRWGHLELCGRECTGPAGSVLLSPGEALVFALLARRRGTAVPREVLAQLLWGGPRPSSRGLDMQISGLRRKLRRVLPGEVTDIILTRRGGGYTLR